MGFDLLAGLDERLAEQNGRIPTEGFTMAEQALVHRGAVVSFYEGKIADAAGALHDRDIIRHPGAVSVAAIDDAGRIVLVQQYRTAVDADLLELPAGKRDVAGEPPQITAARELEEEVGLKAGRLELLCNIHHSPGFCDEYGYIYLASELSDVPLQRQGPEEQLMSVHRIDLAEAAQMCLDGRITDGKSLAGILAAARKFQV